MAEYIERDFLISKLMEHLRKYPNACYSVSEIILILNNVPTADVVEVVRCKDCVYSRELDKYEKKLYLDNCVGCCFHSKSYHSLIMEDKDFCSCGIRKEGAE